jgi:hypothetical protein
MYTTRSCGTTAPARSSPCPVSGTRSTTFRRATSSRSTSLLLFGFLLVGLGWAFLPGVQILPFDSTMCFLILPCALVCEKLRCYILGNVLGFCLFLLRDFCFCFCFCTGTVSVIWDTAQSSCNSTGEMRNSVEGDNFIVIVHVDFRWRRRPIRWLRSTCCNSSVSRGRSLVRSSTSN